MVDRQRMLAELALEEGVELEPYKDTEGNLTCLIGYNVDARGWDDAERVLGRHIAPQPKGTPWFTRPEAYKVCLADIDRVEQVLGVHVPFYGSVDPVRQRVLVDLTFNIGLKTLGFKNTLAAIEARDWSTAAVELHKAHWAIQVEPGVDMNETAAQILNNKIRGRADRLAKMLLTGGEPTDVPALPTA